MQSVSLSGEHRDPVQLRQRWRALREEQPRLRVRDAAEHLGVSEAELIATGIGEDVIVLQPRLDVILPRLESLGPVMALTRNAHAVHEKRGVYRNVELSGARALVLDPDIDLRLFLSHWRFAFAVRESGAGAVKRSLQFFDAAGTAVHKVHLQEGSDVGAFEALVSELAAGSGYTLPPVEARKAAPTPRPDAEVDAEGLRAAWRALQDTHEFFGMLQRFNAGRVQALRLAGPELAQPVSTEALGWTLTRAATSGQSIMVFVGNPGAIQIHTGPVHTVRPLGPWMNVMDPGFNLHVRADHVHSAWVVRKPTRDGVVTSVELFDAEGENIALLFGARKPGIPEDASWRALAEELARTQPIAGGVS
ncbi:hemin-degrading factor [Corallococcus sp. H22C18031201]|uniref:hemin-degrading factor n=1 Tax=Citreicoccus inhibens TaxID=2849499 RepID=UPI000E71AD88|nr:ChuX/HutX family heme-like substrate-binding protein [Citreicoccus inhibens]MBU8894467.1 hemin-degrading factor [Citreicoccus inhibens]RJS16599.1 hemin-degrading factor [Corallococcus sp. H22C18031201]